MASTKKNYLLFRMYTVPPTILSQLRSKLGKPITTVYGTKESVNKLGHLQSTQVADMVDSMNIYIYIYVGWWGMSRNPLGYESFGHLATVHFYDCHQVSIMDGFV